MEIKYLIRKPANNNEYYENLENICQDCGYIYWRHICNCNPFEKIEKISQMFKNNIIKREKKEKHECDLIF